MSELINKLNQYRSMGDKFYPEDIVVIEDIWALIDEIERLHSIIKEVRNCNLKDISILKTRKDMSNEEMIMRLKATNMILDKENI